MIVRIFTGDDGESHFQDVTPDEFAEIANNVGPGDITVGQRPPGGGMITTPLRGISTWCSCPAAPRSKSQMAAKGSLGPAMFWWRKTLPDTAISSATPGKKPGFRWQCP